MENFRKRKKSIPDNVGKGHRCVGCGIVIYGKYRYCMKCAERKGFINNKDD